MRIRHWNATRRVQPMTGVKRYEDELFTHLKPLVDDHDDWSIDRVRRPQNTILGSTFASWALTYRLGEADVVHATDETLAPVGRFRDAPRFVVTCHGLIPLRYPSTIQDLTTRIQWKIVPRTIEIADRIIAISEFTKSEILHFTDIPADRIDVVHHGVDHDTYRPMDKDSCKRRFGLDAETRHVLVVSSSLEQKRMDLAQKSAEIVCAERDDVRFLKAGYGEDLVGDHFVNTGWVEEAQMPELYNAADVYFHPSEYESFGLPVLEAMACGVPVVTSDRASLPEVVGEAGRTVKPGSSDAPERFADEILRALDIGVDEEALARSGEFDWETTASGVIDVYRRL